MPTYGIKITGNAGQFILDSDDTSAEHLTVRTHGALSANSSLSWNPTQEFLLVKAAPGNQIRGNTDFTAQTATNTKVTFTTALNYIILTKTSQVSDLVGGEDYGLEVSNSSGTVVFSTKRIKEGISIERVYNHGEVITNNTEIFTGATTNVYVSIGGWMYSNVSGVVGGFSYETNTIKWNSIFSINFMGIGSISLPNSGSLIIAKSLGI